MKRLTQTRLFSLLSGGKEIFSPGDTDIAPLYDDFVQSAISICTSAQRGMPAHFTLHYTRLELEAFQSRLSTEGAGRGDVGFHTFIGSRQTPALRHIYPRTPQL